MKAYNTILLILLLFPLQNYGQLSRQERIELKAKVAAFEANQHAEGKKALQRGAILVRLQTKQKAIDLMHSKGMEHQAKLIEARQQEYNKSIIEGFKNQFNICPVYFFFSDQSQKILDGAASDITFLDDNLSPDPTIKLSHNDFLIAEFGAIEQVDGEYYEGKMINSNEDGVVIDKVYYGATDFGLPALVIRDKNLIQMRKPFPYYVRTYSSAIFQRSVSSCIRILNKKLKKII